MKLKFLFKQNFVLFFILLIPCSLFSQTAPVFTSTPITSGTQDVLYSYDVVATDADDDDLTHVGVTIPSWLTFTATTSSQLTYVVAPSFIPQSGSNITNFTIDIVQGFTAGDVISFTGTLPSGVTGSYNSTTGVYVFTGTATPANWQTLLRTVELTLSNSSNVTRVVNITENTNGDILSLDVNGLIHYYELVSTSPSSVTWGSAETAAAALTFYGRQGYLATITSQAEQTLIESKLNADTWFGASDAATEGVWEWVTGPEAGTQFWQGQAAGSIVNGGYNNWVSGTEPNDSPDEDHAHMIGASGLWNDYHSANVNVQTYLVEYGNMPGDTPVDVTQSFNVRRPVTYELHGTPGSGHVGVHPVSISASDGTTVLHDFTITITNPPTPGGVNTNLDLWLKSDAGTGSLGTSWQDQSAQGNDYLTQTVGGTPVVVTNSLNYNDGIEIVATDPTLTTNVVGFDAPVGAAITSEHTLFFISKKLATDNVGRIFEGDETNYLWGHHGVNRNGIYFKGGGSPVTDVSAAPADHAGTFTTTDGIEDLHLHAYVRESSGDMDARTDGAILNSYTSSNNPAGVHIDINTGHSGLNGERSDSRIGEMIIYDRALTATEINKVESYLGIKYSISLGSDYTATDNSTFWDVSSAPSYQNGIIGVGRDSGSGLNQKQSRSTNDSLKVYIDALAVGNTSNAGNISNDMSFLMIGHNGEANSDDMVNGSGLTEVPTGLGITSRVEREWKIMNTNFDETFTLEIRLNTIIADGNDIIVLEDDNGDFSNATDASVSGVTFTITTVGLSDVLTISGLSVPNGTTKYITIASTDLSTPLPVELVNFTAELNNRVVELNWETKSEINNDYFMVERSKDGENWENLNQVDGAGNSIVSLNYESFDNNPFVETSYYRLKQVDFDGAFKYSSILAVNFIKTADFELFPNPAKDILNIVSASAIETSEIRLFSNLGVNLMSRDRLSINDENKCTIDIYDLPTGMYTILVNGKSFSFVKE